MTGVELDAKEVTMIKELFPRAHVRLAALPLLGPLLEGFAGWLFAKGFSRNSIRDRIQKAPAFETVLSRHGDFDAKRVSKGQLLALGPPRAQDDIRMSSLVRSLADYLGELDLLAVPARTPSDRLLDAYRGYLLDVRGLAASTVHSSVRLPRELLAFLEFDERERRSANSALHHLRSSSRRSHRASAGRAFWMPFRPCVPSCAS